MNVYIERRDFKHTRGRDVEIDCPYVPVRARKERKAEIKILEHVRGGGVDTCIIQNIYYVFGSIDSTCMPGRLLIKKGYIFSLQGP